eukprot:6483560-Amphidinium_carterae.1
MLAEGKSESLLVHCARQGFYDMPKTGLLGVAREIGADVNPSEKLPQILIQLCEHVLKKLSDEEKLQIVRLRMPVTSELEQLLLESSDAQDMLEAKDVKDLQTHAENKQACAKDFREMTHVLAERVRTSKSKGSAASSSAAGSARASKKRRQYPSEVTFSTALTAEGLKTWVPLG